MSCTSPAAGITRVLQLSDLTVHCCSAGLSTLDPAAMVIWMRMQALVSVAACSLLSAVAVATTHRW
jgi:hypothetical protein